jgi:hypothetical protein
MHFSFAMTYCPLSFHGQALKMGGGGNVTVKTENPCHVTSLAFWLMMMFPPSFCASILSLHRELPKTMAKVSVWVGNPTFASHSTGRAYTLLGHLNWYSPMGNQKLQSDLKGKLMLSLQLGKKASQKVNYKEVVRDRRWPIERVLNQKKRKQKLNYTEAATNRDAVPIQREGNWQNMSHTPKHPSWITENMAMVKRLWSRWGPPHLAKPQDLQRDSKDQAGLTFWGQGMTLKKQHRSKGPKAKV